MAAFNIQIEDNVVLPKREANFGERQPGPVTAALQSMKEGQGFVLPIEGKDAEAIEKRARQKQSSFSGIGKRLGIFIKTRFVNAEPGEGADAYIVSKWNEVKGPFLVVQHAGARPDEALTPEETEAADSDGVDLSDDE